MRTRIAPLLAAALLSSTVAAAQPQNQARARAMPQYKLGLEDLRAERWDKAAESFQRAIEIDPGFEMAYYALGRATMPQKKYAEAAAALTRCRDLYREQAGKQFSNQQELQQYWRDKMTLIDELIRQQQQGPQTGRSAEGLRQLTENRRQIQDN